MDVLQARLSVSITELKKNPSAIIDNAHGQPIAILNHNRPTAYLVPASTFEAKPLLIIHSLIDKGSRLKRDPLASF